MIIDPPDGRIPPLTASGQSVAAARAEARRGRGPADGPEDRSLAERCLAGTLPNLGAVYEIVQSPGQIGIYHDSGQGQGFVRVVPIDSSPHAPSHVRFWKGDARGRWEGDTLVVDITNFTPKREFQGSRENLHLVERLHRTAENRLEYTVTLDDATTWTRPWTIMVPWKKQSDKANQVYESTCHEGNYGMVGMLANTRAAERAFKTGKGKDPRTMDIATGGDTGGGIERAGPQ